MKELLEIQRIKELVKVGSLGLVEGRNQIMEVVENAPFYSVIRKKHSHVITMLANAMNLKELEQDVDRYLRLVIDMCEETARSISADFGLQSDPTSVCA